MSEQIYTMKNTKIFISEDPVASKLEVTPADFQGINWVEIRGLFTVGELGAEQSVNEFELINSDWMQKTKGTRNGGTMANVFIPLALDPGQVKFQEAVNDNCRPYAFKVERGADCTPSSVVTISIAEPGVVTWNSHGLLAGQPVIFENEGGALPTGLTDGTVYYVVAAGLTANSFSVSATVGGAAIDTTGTSTGTTTASAPVAGMTDLFQGLALDGTRSGGGKNDNYTHTYSIAVNGRVITV